MIERMLPQNIDAEIGLLGSIIIDPEVIDLVEYLSPKDFYRDAHRTMYEAVLSLRKLGEPADFITLVDELERIGKLETVGGADYITSLINQVPTSGNAEYYARIIERTAISRRLIHVAGQIAALAYEGDAQALEKSEQLLYTLHKSAHTAAFVGMSQMMNDFAEELEYLHRHRGSILGVPTGYSDLDLTLGGLQKTDLILLAARPGMGKTALQLCIALNAAMHGKKVAIFSLEMGRRQLARRFASMRSKVDMQRLRTGWFGDEQWEPIMQAVGDLSQLPIWINDTAGNPIDSMRNQLLALRREQFGNENPDLIMVDYVGLVDPGETARNLQPVHQISAISRGLKALAREFDAPVLALCQASRAVETRSNKRLMLSDLRDSGSLEQDADVVLFIYRDDYYAALERRESTAPGMAEVHIAKHRNGPTGETMLYWQAEQTAFYDITFAGEE